MKYSKEQLLNFIREAYAKTKLKPCSGQFYNDDETECCPITALHCLRYLTDRRSWFQAQGAMNTVARELGVTDQWVRDFYEGFDYRLREKDGEAFKFGKYVRRNLLTEKT